jgi:hypothetical protein
LAGAESPAYRALEHHGSEKEATNSAKRLKSKPNRTLSESEEPYFNTVLEHFLEKILCVREYLPKGCLDRGCMSSSCRDLAERTTNLNLAQYILLDIREFDLRGPFRE